MTGYLLRPIVPVLVSTSAAIFLVGVLSTIMRGDEIPLFLLQPVVLVLAAGAAYLLDDESKLMTDVVPASMLRRRTSRILVGFAVLAVGGAVLAGLLQRWAPSAPLPALAWETAGLAFLAVAASAVTALHGESEPGNLVTSAGALIFIGVLILQPLLHLNWLLSSPEDSAHAGWWAAVMFAAAALTLLLSSHEWSPPRTRGPRRPRMVQR
jgi:hypothetical protein